VDDHPAPVTGPEAMTRDSVRRRGAGPSGLPLARDAVATLIVIIIGGLLLRVLVGGFLLPLSGFRTDVGDFTAWAQRMAAGGPGAFYSPGYFADYPPGYLYVLWVLGTIGRTFQALIGVDITFGLVKIPGILADAGVAVMLFLYSRRFLDGKFGTWSGEQVGLLAAGIYLLNPGTIFNSAVWGQIDSVGTLVVLVTLYWLARGWTELAALGAVVAFLVKFQFVFVIPIVLVVGLKRHLAGRSADPEHDGQRDLLRVLTSLAVGLGSLVALIWPFGLTLYAPGDVTHGLFQKFEDASRTYAGLSINAINLWRNAWSHLSTGLAWGCDAPSVPPNVDCVNGAGVAFSIGSAVVSWQTVGFVLFGVAVLIALWQLARRDDAEGLLLGALLLAVAFFVLPTRVHERYMFPALALAAPLILRRWHIPGTVLGAMTVAAAALALLLYVVPSGDAQDGSAIWRIATLMIAAVPILLATWGGGALYALLSLSFFANVYWVYTADWSFVQGTIINPGVNGQPMARDELLGATLLSDVGVWTVAGMIVVVLGMLAWRALAHAHAAADDRLAAATEPMRPMPATSHPSGMGAPVASAVSADEDEADDYAWDPGWRVPWLERFRAWLRPDRSDPYLRERGRRIDRLDVAVLVGLVLFAFVFRLWRLDTPRSMHFDEVYHARSATEWLADWQEGWKRDTYEWTHPMLAKYLIAAGIVAADPNKIIGQTSLPAPFTALAVASQRAEDGIAESIVFGASGRTITAMTVLGNQAVASWQASGEVASLAFDPDNHRLLVGLARDGTVHTYDTQAFLAVTGARGPPPEGQQIDTGLRGVLQIDIPAGQPNTLFRGPNGIVATERGTGVELARTKLVAGGVGYVPAVSQNDVTTGPFVVATDMQAGRLAVLDPASLLPVEAGVGGDRSEQLPSSPIGPIQVRGAGDDLQVWVPVGRLKADSEQGPTLGGITVFDDTVNVIDTAPLPGGPALIGWNSVVNMISIAGQDASSKAPAVWTVQPIGNGGAQSAGFAAFDTTLLPAKPLAMAFDVNDHDQDLDHERLLVSADAGSGPPSLIQIDAGSNAFAWRISGVVFGSLLVALVYLLALTMFSRRRIAVLAAIFVAVDGMSYVMSRISMNDIFVAFFITAAYLVFWQIWSGRWARSAWWALPLVGVLIGLAAASKWVGIYALAGIWILVLARSALGRFLLVALIGLVAVVAGIDAPWPFTVLVLGTLALALLIVWVRPIQLELGDLIGLAATVAVLSGIGLAFAMAYNQVPDARNPNGAVELVFGVLARGAQVAWPAWIMLAVAGVLIVLRAAWSLRDPDSDARWMQPGELGGFSWPWIWACLAVVPLLVYFVAYIPYLELGHAIAGAKSGPGYGWTLDELHAQMFGYHFGLQAGHPSSSPWWSWPLDLKPVWFYGHEFDGRRNGVIYNGGNPILFWAGVPAMIWCAFQAWRRRSPALVLLVVAFAFQFLPWTRIERATFAYHYLTALIFAMVAVAYVVDEALRSWSWRPYAIAYLVLAAAAGFLVYPLGSAMAMPDWYINAARSYPPWNYAFQFPNPPQGPRAELVSTNALKLAAGTLVAISAAAFALFGRPLLGPRPPHGDQEQDEPQQDEGDRPDEAPVEGGQVLLDQEPDPGADEDQPEDQRAI
jgi:predicted membrane-bound dolichyl-phosphate-mannose-protein mannosyltransferase/Gpi18-like mannosyltransferase